MILKNQIQINYMVVEGLKRNGHINN